MENGVHALFMAFAAFLFAFALGISFTFLSQAKSTADTVLFFSDREIFQDYVSPDLQEQNDGGRTVGVDTVISTLAKCTHENFGVTIINSEETLNFDYAIDSTENIKNNIKRFIEDNVGSNKTYRETYTEVTLNGVTYIGEDGTKLEEDVGKKIYITYREDSVN